MSLSARRSVDDLFHPRRGERLDRVLGVGAGRQQLQLAAGAAARREADVDRDAAGRPAPPRSTSRSLRPGESEVLKISCRVGRRRSPSTAVDAAALGGEGAGDVGGDVALAAAGLGAGDQHRAGAVAAAVARVVAGALEREDHRRAQAAEGLQRRLVAAPLRDLAEQLQAEVAGGVLGGAVAVEEEVAQVDRGGADAPARAIKASSASRLGCGRDRVGVGRRRCSTIRIESPGLRGLAGDLVLQGLQLDLEAGAGGVAGGDFGQFGFDFVDPLLDRLQRSL